MLLAKLQKALLVLLFLAFISSAGGCKSTAGNVGIGAAGGAVAGAAAYEYHAKRQVDKIDQDLKDGKIDQQEYDIRKDQINRDFLLQK